MLPINRPVIGRDIEDLRMAYGLSVEDARSLFRMTQVKWSEIVRQGAEQPVRDVPLALLVRLLDSHRDLFQPPDYPHPGEMKTLFESISGSEMEQKRLSVLLGSDGSSAHRWLKAGSRQNPSVQILMLFIEKLLLSSPPGSQRDLLEQWEKFVFDEGHARTGKDVLKTGRWDRQAESKTTKSSIEK